MIYREQKSYQQALRDLQSAIASQPDNSLGYAKIGVIYFDLNDRSKACTNFRKALELDIVNDDLEILIQNSCS